MKNTFGPDGMNGIPSSVYPDHDMSAKEAKDVAWETDNWMRYKRKLMPPVMEPPVEAPVVVVDKPVAGVMPDEHWDAVAAGIFAMEGE